MLTSPSQALRPHEWGRGTQECVRHERLNKLSKTFRMLIRRGARTHANACGPQC